MKTPAQATMKSIVIDVHAHFIPKLLFERFDANARKFPGVKLMRDDKGVRMQFPGTEPTRPVIAEAFRSRRPPRVDGQERHRSPARRRLARQLRLRAAAAGRSRVEPLHQRLHVGRATRRAALHAARHGAAAGRQARRRGADRGDGQGFRRRHDRHAAQRHAAAISTIPSLDPFWARRIEARRRSLSAPDVHLRRAAARRLRSRQRHRARWPTHRSRSRACCSPAIS